MKKLWQKDWTLNHDAEVFETQSDLHYDHHLLFSDVLASYAHAHMLRKINLLSEQELEKIGQGLAQILQLNFQNQFSLQIGDEDIHTKIENFLTEQYGEVGKKIHTGRSRNDQVLTALRLFAKAQLLEIWQETLQLVAVCHHFAKKYEFVPMVGYTHMQPAMPSSFGMWATALSEGLLDDLHVLKTAYQLNDQSPLGSAAGYGVPLSLDREFVAEQLGFAKVQRNSLYCQNSRGKIEAVTLAALQTILFDLNKLASDALFFTTNEVAVLEADKQICSGSSMMPQKKNPDMAELLRSKIHLVLGNYVQISSLATNLISGYNRDLQDSKKPFIESLLMTVESVKMAQLLVRSLQPKNISPHLPSEIFATHHALNLVMKGIPFRDAYQQTAALLQARKISPPNAYLHQATHVGGTGNLQLKELAKELSAETHFFQLKNVHFTSHMAYLLQQLHVTEGQMKRQTHHAT